MNERTFNLDLDDAAEKITGKTKAVVGVHLFGQPFAVKALQALCEDHQLLLIEDCAQAHGAEYERARVGTFGDLSCFSFYGTKNMTTGEGGMVTTNDSRLAERWETPHQTFRRGLNREKTITTMTRSILYTRKSNILHEDLEIGGF